MARPEIYVALKAPNCSVEARIEALAHLLHLEVVGKLPCAACGGGGIVEKDGREGTCERCLGIGVQD